MTTDSTKYFCKRGAVSARLNLVDASLSVEYCYVNPYSYGGDPLNYIDPTGMWAIGLGLVVGWDNKSGWSFGVGAAADFEIIGANFSYTFNQDGSKSLNLGVNANIPIQTPWVYLEINMGLGFSMNSYSGATLSTHGGLCVGEVGLCGGVENGGSLYWDRGGSFMGATVYAGVYASLGYGAARVSAGYEAGLFGMEGRGLYAGASAGGLYAQYAQNGGLNFGGSFQAYLAYGYNTGKKGADGKTTSLVSAELWIPTLGKYGHFAFGETYDVSDEGLDDALVSALTREKILKEGERIDYKRPAALDAIHQGLLSKGYSCEITEPNTLFNQHDGRKFTYSKNGEYGNIEIIRGSKSYSSYNYGNNLLTHYVIDYRGYKGRGY